MGVHLLKVLKQKHFIEGISRTFGTQSVIFLKFILAFRYDLEKYDIIVHFLEIKDMDRPQNTPRKGRAQAGTAEEIREEWIQHASMAVFEDW